MTRLGDVCQIDPPKSEARQKLSSSDTVSFVPMSDLCEGQKHFEPKQARQFSEVVGSYTYFADNDVLLAKITPCFENGKLGIAQNLTNGIGFGSSEYLVLRPSSALSPDYLYYFLDGDSFRQAGARVMSGAVGHKRVPKDFVENLMLRVPSIAEQKRIVAILDEAFAGIAAATANAEKNLANARELFEGYLASVFSSEEGGWVTKRLQDVCERITDGTHQTPTYFDDGIVFLSSRNVTSGRINWDNVKYIDQRQHLEMHKRVAPRMGDILLAKNGTTGVAAIVDRDTVFDIYVSLALLRPLKAIRPDLLLYFVNSPVAKKQFNKRLKGTGVPNLHLEEIREVLVSFPVSETAQEALVSRLKDISTKFNELEQSYQKKLLKLAELKQAILRQAFSGELTALPGAEMHEEAA